MIKTKQVKYRRNFLKDIRKESMFWNIQKLYVLKNPEVTILTMLILDSSEIKDVNKIFLAIK